MDGTGDVRLTYGEKGESSPRWSPDGNYVAFLATRGEDEFSQIYLLPNGGGEASPLTSHESSVQSFEFSPDGARIAHHRAPSPLFDNRDEGEVWIMDADGGNALHLTDNTVGESGAELSPDGRYVMFLTNSSGDLETYFNTC